LKSNKADKIFGYFIAIFFAGCGMLSLYRATLTENDLVMLNGILKSAKVVEVTSYGSKGGKKHSYPITLKFEGDKQLYGFYVSNKNKAEDMLRSINFEIGERYSIFYDPTVVAGFANVKQEEIDWAVNEINNRPRKRLGYLTPYEVFYEKNVTI